jgi:hypothetical protein
METIMDHVVSWAHVEFNGLLLGVVCLTDLGYCVMEAIMWKVSREFTKFQASYAHLGQDALYLQVAILRT